MNKYDFIVIGGGSGGVRFARLVGAKGYKVALIESDDIGGTCVMRGCIPKKLMIYASSVAREIKQVSGFGWNIGESSLNWQHFMSIKDQELQRLSKLYQDILIKNNVEVIRGFARFTGKDQIEVDGSQYTADKVIIATGGVSRKLNIPGSEYIIDSSAFLQLDKLPSEVVVVGNGIIALEFINILLSFGIKVHIVTRGYTVLKPFDDDISQHMTEQLSQQGVSFISDSTIVKVIKNKQNKLTTTFSDNKSLEVDLIVEAIGRLPNTESLQLEKAEVDYEENGAVKVDEYLATSNKKVYAIGDVLHKLDLTPVAIQQAILLAHNLTNPNLKPQRFDYKFIPGAVFSYPEVASCGLTESQALNHGYKLKIFKSNFKPLKYSLLSTSMRSLFKIIVDKKSNRVLGMHICDINAAEIMQGFAVALKQGILKDELDLVVGIHPSSAEELVSMYHPV